MPRLFKFPEFDDDVHFFRFTSEIFLFKKIGQKFQSCYKILFKLFNLVVGSFKCGKLLKIPKNSSALYSILFNFKKHTFYFELINVFPIKHVLKILY